MAVNGGQIQSPRRPNDNTKWQLDCTVPEERGEEGGKTGAERYTADRIARRDGGVIHGSRLVADVLVNEVFFFSAALLLTPVLAVHV